MSDAVNIQPHEHEHVKPETPQRIENVKFAMWLYLASDTVIFAVLIATFLIFRANNEGVVREVQEHSGLLLVSINTFLLLSSSWAMVMGLREIKKGNRRGLINWIFLTAVLGAVFVGLQAVEYSVLAAEGITIYGSEFGMRFYAPTAFHGAHVVIGVLWALAICWHTLKGGYGSKNYVGVEVFGLYWHLVDVVWILLFTIIYLV